MFTPTPPPKQGIEQARETTLVHLLTMRVVWLHQKYIPPPLTKIRFPPPVTPQQGQLQRFMTTKQVVRNQFFLLHYNFQLHIQKNAFVQKKFNLRRSNVCSD